MKYTVFGIAVVASVGCMASTLTFIDVPKSSMQITRVMNEHSHHYLISITRSDSLYAPFLGFSEDQPKVSAGLVGASVTNIKVDVVIHDDNTVEVGKKPLRNGIESVKVMEATVIPRSVKENPMLEASIKKALHELYHMTKLQISAKIITVSKPNVEGAPTVRHVILTQKLISQEGVKLVQKTIAEHILEVSHHGHLTYVSSAALRGDENAERYGLLTNGMGHITGMTDNNLLAAGGQRNFHALASSMLEGSHTSDPDYWSQVQQVLGTPLTSAKSFWAGMPPVVHTIAYAALASFSVVFVVLLLPMLYVHYREMRTERQRRRGWFGGSHSNDMPPPYKAVMVVEVEDEEDDEECNKTHPNQPTDTTPLNH
ncbi:hypothetical protein IWQ61_008047 [Dispira simplex]|nr:hypothetical protein IWQ61_008047 [Dispira simplex]